MIEQPTTSQLVYLESVAAKSGRSELVDVIRHAMSSGDGWSAELLSAFDELVPGYWEWSGESRPIISKLGA